MMLGAATFAHGAQAEALSPRLTEPRLAPVAPGQGNEAQRTWLAKRTDANVYKTYARNLDLAQAVEPFLNFALKGSGLPPREREIVILRMGWLCQAEYEWAHHARIGKRAGLTGADVHRIAAGPEAEGWSDFDRVLLRMVDELRYDAMVSDATWRALRARYSDAQAIDAVATAGQYQFISMFLNSLGVQLDSGIPDLVDRLPRDVAAPEPATRPASPRLTRPRLEPVAAPAMTPEQRDLVQAQLQKGVLPNFDATLLNHQKLYGPYKTADGYIQHAVLLPPKTREILLLRTAWNTRDAYGWAHHVGPAKAAGLTDVDVARVAAGPSASGWNEDQLALLRAADELQREAFISDATWRTLAKYYDSKQLVDIVNVVGNFAINGQIANTLGVQVEAGYPAMPKG